MQILSRTRILAFLAVFLDESMNISVPFMNCKRAKEKDQHTAGKLQFSYNLNCECGLPVTYI